MASRLPPCRFAAWFAMARRRPLYRLAACLVGLAGVLTACSPGPRPRGATAGREARRVILLSLDGASADLIERSWRSGELSAGGFAAFFERGTHGRLVPANPTLTAPSHATLATGTGANMHGIVSNRFRLAETKWGDCARGFNGTVGVETLWQAARRQGKRVGALAFPGTDATTSDRRADWGMGYSEERQSEPFWVNADAGNFLPYKGALPAKLRLARTPLTLTFFVRDREGGIHNFHLLAVDEARDKREGYDRLWVDDDADFSRDTLHAGIAPGTWIALPYRRKEGARVTATAKLTELGGVAPRLALYVGAGYEISAYPAEFRGQLEALTNWTGPPDSRAYQAHLAGRAGIDGATFVEQLRNFSNFFARTFEIAMQRPDWQLLMAYQPLLDEAQHEVMAPLPGAPFPDTAYERRATAIVSSAYQQADRLLAALVARLDSHTVLAVVSDHGTTAVTTRVNLAPLLARQGLVRVNAAETVRLAEDSVVSVCASGALAHLYVRVPGAPERGGPEHAIAIERVVAALAAVRWEGASPFETIATAGHLEGLGMAHPDSGDVVVFAAPGFAVNFDLEGRDVFTKRADGNHGHLNHHSEMHGIFLAYGPGVAARDASSLDARGVAAWVAARLGIDPPAAAAPPFE